MHLKGTHRFQASTEQLYTLLLEPDVLARITPGISKLEKTGEDQYKAIAEVKMGPVHGTFTGQLDVANKIENESFLLKISQKSKIGDVSADVSIRFKEITAAETELAFDGKAKLTGVLARTGQRVLSGVANTISKLFFKALEEEIKTQKFA